MQEIHVYKPQAALVIYETNGSIGSRYVESFTFDKNGYPINAHPLTENEAVDLAKSLVPAVKEKAFLKPTGIVPENVLHFNPTASGSVTWYTPAGKRNILYVDNLKIPNGEASVPALLWHATMKSLYIFALPDKKRPTLQTPLFRAPFFNINHVGLVCMGSVRVKIKDDYSLERFMKDWEEYFFGSRFTHAGSPVTKTSFFALWKRLHKTGVAFPKEELVKSNVTIKSLIK